jgi:hypothetical protein
VLAIKESCDERVVEKLIVEVLKSENGAAELISEFLKGKISKGTQYF